MELYQLRFEDVVLDGSSGTRQKKMRCPNCGHDKRYVRYFHILSNEYLPEQYGRCDREIECGYIHAPFDDIKRAKEAARENGSYVAPAFQQQVKSIAPTRERKLCSRENMQATHAQYHMQPLYLWFCAKFGQHAALDVFKLYQVGTSRDTSTLFWQIDIRMQVRTCQKIAYVGYNRNKAIPPIRLFKTGDGYDPCFFGEHVLRMAIDAGMNPVVCIVESEKTAIICSLYMPTIPTKGGERNAVWLASSGSNGLTDEKIAVLRGMDVALFPDFAYVNRAEWGLVPMRKSEKEIQTASGVVKRRAPDPAGEICQDYVSAKQRIEMAGARCRVFDACPDRNDGSDIADHLILGEREVFLNLPDRSRYLKSSQSNATALNLPLNVGCVHSDARRLNKGQYGYEKQVFESMANSNPALWDLYNRTGMQLVDAEG